MGSARSTGEPVSSTPQQQEKRFVYSSLPSDQAYIDAGQKELGATLCPTCGSVYSKGDPQDEAMHNIQHTGLLERLKHQGWSKERVVATYPEGSRVISIRPGDDSRWWKKAEDVLGIVDRDLGFSEVGIRAPDRTKVFLFIADKKIVGLLLAEQISQGYQIIPPTEGDTKGQVYCCSETPQPVLAGISRIWVLADYRRKGWRPTWWTACALPSLWTDTWLRRSLLSAILGCLDWSLAESFVPDPVKAQFSTICVAIHIYIFNMKPLHFIEKITSFTSNTLNS